MKKHLKGIKIMWSLLNLEDRFIGVTILTPSVGMKFSIMKSLKERELKTNKSYKPHKDYYPPF